MSVVVPEPPPPPPPPPPQRPANTFDFVRPLAFVFEDPRWIPKVLLGGVFMLAAAIFIGIFFLYGYLARLVRNVVDGVEFPLPEWDDLGEFFSEGLLLFCVSLVYAIPVAMLGFAIFVPAALLGGQDSDAIRSVGGGMLTCLSCLIVPVALAMAIWMPAALLMAIVSRRFSAAFEFSRIAAFIRANVANYLLAIVVFLVARFAAGIVGIILLCVGLLFTEFWALVVGAYAFANAYRLSTVK